MSAGVGVAPIAAEPGRRSNFWRRFRRWVTVLFVLALVGGASAGIYRYRQSMNVVTYPVAPARQGDFLVIIRCRGELKADRSLGIYAPRMPDLRIAWLAPAGEAVKKGVPIIRFDSSTAQQQLQQKEAVLRQSQATLDQALAQARITAEQDKSDLADSGFTVERARLEVSKMETVSRLQGESAAVDLKVAEQKSKVQEATVALHATADKSKIASLTRLRDQAAADVDLTKTRIAQMELTSPIDGILVFASNYSQGWMNAKPFKVGDNVFAGMQIADMPDLTTLVMDGKVEEIDRGRIQPGQDVRVRVDSLPELTMNAKVTNISLMAETTNEFPPTRNFRAYAPLMKPDSRLRPGMNGGVDIVINRIPNAISIPSKALFTHAGKPVVYVADKGQYKPVHVEVQARNPDEVAITGLPAGALVTLVDIEKKDQKK
ncbi:MAG TPA: efflux RND transporter periplasmic adaptor subunit [Candidatus Acidoferrum sp.]|nr:efflux RND transporter periplasmic adaptor subunit [Candidatus Acidoferrum sp.]